MPWLDAMERGFIFAVLPEAWSHRQAPGRAGAQGDEQMGKTYSDLLSEVKGQIKQVSLDEMKRRLDAKEDYVFEDEREKDETKNGFIPGAVLQPRGFLEMQAESKLPDRNK
jgi:hypothetical protein